MRERAGRAGMSAGSEQSPVPSAVQTGWLGREPRFLAVPSLLPSRGSAQWRGVLFPQGRVPNAVSNRDLGVLVFFGWVGWVLLTHGCDGTTGMCVWKRELRDPGYRSPSSPALTRTLSQGARLEPSGVHAPHGCGALPVPPPGGTGTPVTRSSCCLGTRPHRAAPGVQRERG